MTDRRIEAFFDGLFTDVDVLRGSRVVPSNSQRAYVDDFALRIGQRVLRKLSFPPEYLAGVS